MILEVEKSVPEMLGSVLVLDEEGRHLHHGAAPSLPDAYIEAVNGREIGPCEGSCGTAAFRSERVIVSDIATDPLWTNYKELALSHGLAACWSEPICDESGQVLGTFAMYYRKRRAPQAFELKIVELMSGLTAIAIRHKQLERVQQQRATRIAAEFEAITTLGRTISREDCPTDLAMRHICESAANTLRVERASIWRLRDEDRELCSLNLFERTPNRHSSSPNTVFSVSNYPAYFTAIKRNRVQVAQDARSDPDTREFRDSYLIPHNIHSLLVASIRVEGELFGVLCLEQTGHPRPWFDDEVGFAGEMADQMTQVLLREKTRQIAKDLELAASVFSKSPMGIFITDKKATILRVNQAFTDITGYSAEEAIGQNPRILKSGRQDKAFYQSLWTSLQETGRWEGEIWDRRKSGDVYPEWSSIASVKDANGEVTHYISSFTDITKKKLSEKHVQ